MPYKHGNNIFHAVPELIRKGNALLRNAGRGYIRALFDILFTSCFLLQYVWAFCVGNVGNVFGVPQGAALVPLSLCGWWY